MHVLYVFYAYYFMSQVIMIIIKMLWWHVATTEL